LDRDDFLIHDPVRTPWQRATRDALVDHCKRTNRPIPTGEGPGHNAIDAAGAVGQTAGGIG
jgi:hypothetical protein